MPGEIAVPAAAEAAVGGNGQVEPPVASQDRARLLLAPLEPVAAQHLFDMVRHVPLPIGRVQVATEGPRQEAFDLSVAREQVRKYLLQEFPVAVAELGGSGFAGPAAREGDVGILDVMRERGSGGE